MKYIELITNAYRLRNVIDATQAPSAEQGAHAVMLLNQLMAELAADGVDLNYVPITMGQVGDTLTIPMHAEGGITAELATRIVSGRRITPELERQHAQGMGTILRKANAAKLTPPSMQHVPQGEGTRRRGDFYTG